ncbi:MAG TPA: deoxyribose-phosphate aldolase [Gammaproteobacteria bacterium]|jgi:deoxyribose-phosphate aldolase|nr:deoxyribose-phosphate aldolase [Gammaproteobacteria bacterium]
MDWIDDAKENVEKQESVELNPALIQRILSLVDMTRLQDDDNEENIAAFLEKVRSFPSLLSGQVASVCVYPEFVKLAASALMGTGVKIGTVANFPEGEASLEATLIEINQALIAGAQEVDVVMPYRRYLAGEREYVYNFVSACRAACGSNITLKVILETGLLQDSVIIAAASLDVFSAGADFIKTSTGKIREGATLEAAATMLLAIREVSTKIQRPIGLKVSGGIADLQQAAHYVALAETMMGKEWVTVDTFRIGTSRLPDMMLQWKQQR